MIEGLLPRGEVTLITGRGNAGKTMLLLQAACCMAAELPFLGMPIKGETSLIISPEEGLSNIWQRIQLLGDGLGLSMAQRNKIQIECLEAGPAAFVNVSRDKAEISDVGKAVLELVSIVKPDFIEVDGRNEAFGGDPINIVLSGGCMSVLKQIARAGNSALALVTHPSLGGNNVAGSETWHNMSRALWMLGRAKGEEEGRSLEIVRWRGPKPAKVRWDLSQDPNTAMFSVKVGIQPPSKPKSPDKDLERVFALVKQCNSADITLGMAHTRNYAPKVISKMHEATGLGKPRILECLEKLMADGKIIQDHVGPPSKRRETLKAV